MPFINFVSVLRDVVLMLHFNGTNGSTTFTDSSAYNHTMTAVGNAQLSTTSPLDGSASGLFDGNGDYVIAQSDKFKLGAGDFTIEWFEYCASSSNKGRFHIRQYAIDSGIINAGGVAVGYNGSNWAIYCNGLTDLSSSSLTLNSWKHCALTRKDGTVRFFYDGSQVGSSFTRTTNFTDTHCIVANYYDPSFGYDGKMDEFSITVGEAKYTSNFTPPTPPLPNA